MGSLTFGKGAKTAAKEKRKVMSRVHAEEEEKKAEIFNLAGRKKIEYDIGNLENAIRNCKYDLSMTKDNLAMTNKLKLLQESLVSKKLELEEFGEEDAIR